MPRGQTLLELRDLVKFYANIDSSIGASDQVDRKINAMLNGAERQAALAHDWPHLNIEETVVVPAETQFVDMPATMSFETINEAVSINGNCLVTMYHGIGAHQRLADQAAERGTYVQRWEVVQPGSDQFEVWPIQSQESTIIFAGQAVVGGMSKDTDVCVIDGDILANKVAGTLLAQAQDESAPTYLNAANDFLVSALRRQGSDKRAQISLLGGGRRGMRQPGDFRRL